MDRRNEGKEGKREMGKRKGKGRKKNDEDWKTMRGENGVRTKEIKLNGKKGKDWQKGRNGVRGEGGKNTEERRK